MAALSLGLWLAATLFWWAFAFMPLPVAPPPWLTAARDACFGVTAHGLPAVSGWLMLVLAPLMSLAAIVAMWGAEVTTVLRRAASFPFGRALIAGIAVLVVVEGTWVTAKVRAAGRVASVRLAAADGGDLPLDYPRERRAVADFTLVDQSGATVTLAALRGRPVVLSFVFAHCATLCPLVVETVKQAAPDPASAEVLLVTLDPWRDTPSVLPAIARRWQVPAHVHVLSSRHAADVLGVARAYAVPFQRDETTGDIAHPALVFVIDAQGRLAYTFNNPAPAWVRQALARLG